MSREYDYSPFHFHISQNYQFHLAVVPSHRWIILGPRKRFVFVVAWKVLGTRVMVAAVGSLRSWLSLAWEQCLTSISHVEPRWNFTFLHFKHSLLTAGESLLNVKHFDVWESLNGLTLCRCTIFSPAHQHKHCLCKAKLFVEMQYFCDVVALDWLKCINVFVTIPFEYFSNWLKYHKLQEVTWQTQMLYTECSSQIKNPWCVTLNQQQGDITLVTSLWRLSGVLVSKGICTFEKWSLERIH